MEIKERIQIEEQNIGDSEEIQSSIREEDLGFALNSVSKNLYSNPIGSFIRELVSNGVDANVDNFNRTKAIAVETRLYKEGNEWWFAVRDFGTGMSKEHFNKVYMKWFNSDKRKTNRKIGGWGLGSKTPLAYGDEYELETIHEGIKYDYVIAKSVPVPIATLLLEVPTTEPSGTLVKFVVKEKDLSKISSELIKQLSYFNEVVVIDENGYYENDFTILETDLYKYRPNKVSFLDTFASELHAVIGQVPYKLDFSMLDRPRIYMPLAVKFDTGDIPVTLSREDINYEDEEINVIEIINAKIDAVLDDISARYEDFMNFINLKDYIAYRDQEAKYINLGEYKLKIDTNVIKNKPKLQVGTDQYIFTKEVLEYLPDLFNYNNVLQSKLSRTSYHYKGLGRLFDNPDVYVFKQKESNHWSNKFYFNKIAISTAKFNRRNYIYFAEKLKLGITTQSIGGRYRVFVPGGLRQAIKLHKFFINSVKETLESYDEVPQWYIDADKAAQKDISLAKKGKITSYNSYGAMTEYDVDNLLNAYDHVFYIDRKADNEKIAYYNMLFRSMPKYFKDKLILLHLNPTTIKGLKKFKSQVHEVETIWGYKKLWNFYNKLPTLIKLATIFKVDKGKISEFSPYYYSLLVKPKKGTRPLYFEIPVNNIEVRDLETKTTPSFEFKGFLPYFEKQLTMASKALFKEKKVKKVYPLKEEIDALYELLPILNLYTLLGEYPNSEKKEMYKFIISRLKIRKIKQTL